MTCPQQCEVKPARAADTRGGEERGRGGESAGPSGTRGRGLVDNPAISQY